MKYSIIMPCLFRKEEHKKVVLECIESVKSSSSDYEFIIVDDGSPLDTTFLKEAATKYIRHEKPMGIATGWNDGLKIARGDYMVVINDDIVARSGWLECMVEGLEKVESALVSAPAVDGFAEQLGISEPHENRVWFPGYCFMFKRETIENIGYFDEQFSPFNYEDVDYWTRVYESGYVLARNYTISIKHHEGQVIHGIDNNSEVDMNNRRRYLEKWGFDPIPILYGKGLFPWEEVK